MPNVLIVEDDANTLSEMAQLVSREGFEVFTASTLAEARACIATQRLDMILSDLMLPDGDGMELLEKADPPLTAEVVVITGYASIETSIRALRLGAVDYLIKPIKISHLKNILARIAQPTDLKSEINTLRGELRRLGHFGRLMGSSPAMQQIYDQISRVAPTSATVLITGESGTGKEIVAQTIHELSRRHKQVFLPVNCGAISPQLIESELFGHEKGSFTGATREHKGFFERANGGTIFLDEITEMPIELQVKLLRVLETGVFMRVGSNKAIDTDVRIIAATNRLPEEAVATGKLREDLLYRLQVFPIQLPPLRGRGEDLELLIADFINEANKHDGTHKMLSARALAALKKYHWPGNVRELKNIIQRAFIMADETIELENLPPELEVGNVDGPSFTVSVGSTVAEVERRLIMSTLAYCQGAKDRAAKMLGLSLKTIYNRLKEYEAGNEPTVSEQAE
jgi:DNA-binding NtrC family response regulator